VVITPLGRPSTGGVQNFAIESGPVAGLLRHCRRCSGFQFLLMGCTGIPSDESCESRFRVTRATTLNAGANRVPSSANHHAARVLPDIGDAANSLTAANMLEQWARRECPQHSPEPAVRARCCFPQNHQWLVDRKAAIERPRARLGTHHHASAYVTVCHGRPAPAARGDSNWTPGRQYSAILTRAGYSPSGCGERHVDHAVLPAIHDCL